MILAGDVGGTKTVLAIYKPSKGLEQPVREERFASAEFGSFAEIIDRFLSSTGVQADAASFGVAGPVADGEAKITNLPWIISADSISQSFNIPKVNLLNDLEAVATAVPFMGAGELLTLNAGRSNPTGAKAVVAPGTGLGAAFLVWTGQRYQACPTEGGHASFAPVTHEQVELLNFLEPRFGHVSFERVCSGSGIPNLYDFLSASGEYEEPDWLREKLATARDRTPIITLAALDRKALICVATLDLFVRILGGVIGNFALELLATGGVYLGGWHPAADPSPAAAA